jgi:hypothetical protein
MHVAKIERRYQGKVYRSYLLRRTYREGDRVKHQTLGNLSHLPAHLIELIRRGLRGEDLLAASDAFAIVRTRPHGHVAATLGTLRLLGLDRLVSSTADRRRDLVVGMIVARILEPRSKLATAQALDAGTLHSTLGEALGLETVHEEELYAAMDWLLGRQARIEAKLAGRHLEEGSLVFYDVTSTYFEGRHCPLARLGHSRDEKKGTLQIVFGLLCNAEGCPVAVEVFEGNTGDPKTLATQIHKLKNRFGLKHVVLVGDRGLITDARLRDDIRPEGLDWITALRAPAIEKLVREGGLQLGLFDTRDLAEITSPDYPGERLIVCRNPLLAAERARKRDDLLLCTERELTKIAQATLREKRRLQGKDRIGLRVGKVLGRFKVGKHFRIDIRDDGFHFERDADAIAQEAALDGFYVIRTSVATAQLSAEDTVRTYKRLASVERAFRSLKSVDLKVRPIHHHLADRVRAHVFLCMLAYYVEWHMRRALAPLLFDDEQPPRSVSPVAPAQRSAQALTKAHRKQRPDGMPVQSFQGLLQDLATLAKNRIQPKAEGAVAFDVLTQPTALHRRALDLLGVSAAV